MFSSKSALLQYQICIYHSNFMNTLPDAIISFYNHTLQKIVVVITNIIDVVGVVISISTIIIIVIKQKDGLLTTHEKHHHNTFSFYDNNLKYWICLQRNSRGPWQLMYRCWALALAKIPADHSSPYISCISWTAVITADDIARRWFLEVIFIYAYMQTFVFIFV